MKIQHFGQWQNTHQTLGGASVLSLLQSDCFSFLCLKGCAETEEKTAENKDKKTAHKREALSAQENLEHTKKVCL